MFAPHIDTIIESLKTNDIPVSYENHKKLLEIYNVFSTVKPGSDDKIRHTWIEVECGPIEAFGNYKELKKNGDVTSRSEFEQLWKDFYPEKTKWYRFSTKEYQEDKFFFLDGRLLARISGELFEPKDRSYHWDLFGQFVDWLQERISAEMDKLKDDPEAYNTFIRNNLPYVKRYGKIQRAQLWDILGDEANRIDVNLGEETISKLKQFVKPGNSIKAPWLEEMTADNFFRICEIGYDANNYFRDSKNKLTPRDKYLGKSDGRDAGLSRIDGNSAQEFYKWYHHESIMGAHPWEICRGGNSTHISLYVFDQGGKWYLCLAGSSTARVEETVRMAVALNENGIPFELRDADQIVRMVTGTDFIGIVPNNIIPVYCHSSFPKEDNIFEFMNLGFDTSLAAGIVSHASWYPLEEILPE